MSPTLKYLDPADGQYKVILGGGGGAGGNEVTVSANQPTDGSELWLRTTDSVLLYLSSGNYIPIAGSVAPIDGIINAGNGLTGGGAQSTNPTLNVGAGTGITVAADTVAVNKATLDSWYATPTPAFSGFSRATDIALTADAYYKVTYETTTAQPSGTVAAVTHTNGQTFTVLRSGLYALQLSPDVMHGTTGTEGTFQLRMTFSDGVQPAQSGYVRQHLGGWPYRPGNLVTTRYITSGTTVYTEVRPAGVSAGVGWQLTYAGFSIRSVYKF